MPSPSKKVWERIKIDFEPEIQSEIAEALNLYEDNERQRVQLYILQLANGNRKEVFKLIGVANQDYRDIIFWAENLGESQTKATVIEQVMKEIGESKE